MTGKWQYLTESGECKKNQAAEQFCVYLAVLLPSHSAVFLEIETLVEMLVALNSGNCNLGNLMGNKPTR